MDAGSPMDVPQDPRELVPGPRRPGTPFLVAGLVVVVVVAAIVIGNFSTNSSAGAAAAVRQSLLSTLAMKSAAFNLAAANSCLARKDSPARLGERHSGQQRARPERNSVLARSE